MASQIGDHSVIDADGFAFSGQLWVPASGASNGRGTYPFYGVDGQTDGAGNPYAALAVADHLPLTPAGGHLFWAAGQTGTVALGMTPAPGANGLAVLSGFVVSCQDGSAAQRIGIALTGITAPIQSWWLTILTTQAVTLYVPFPRPIQATAANTTIGVSITFPAASTARVDAGLWGFNRAV